MSTPKRVSELTQTTMAADNDLLVFTTADQSSPSGFSSRKVIVGDAKNILARSNSEIKTAYESNPDTNAYTDSEKTKLSSMEAGATADQTPTEIKTAYEINSDTNAYTDSEKTKLSSVEAGATADQTPTEIKTAYESNPDTNAYTDSEKTKLTGVEVGATGDQTPAEIKTAYESNPDTNAYTDNEKTKLAGLDSSHYRGLFTSESDLNTAHPTASPGDYADVDLGTDNDVIRYIWDDNDSKWIRQEGAGTELTDAQVKTKYENNADTNAYTDYEKTKLAGVDSGAEVNVNSDWNASSGDAEILNKPTDLTNLSSHSIEELQDVSDKGSGAIITSAERTKLAGVETGATADQTPTEIKTAYESNSDTNAYTDAEKTKLTGIETGATADQTPTEIKTAYEINSDTNAYTDNEKTKLAGLDSSHYRGLFTSESDLNTAHPTASPGDYADVDLGTGNDIARYIWDDDDTQWVAQAGTSTELTDAQVKTKYENNPDTNAYTDAEKSKLAGVDDGAEKNTNADWNSVSGDAEILNKPSDLTDLSAHSIEELQDVSDKGSGAIITSAERTKLAGVETGATADQTPVEIKTAYESNSDTNAYTDAEKTTTAKVAPGDWSKGDSIELNYSPTSGYTEVDDTVQGHLTGISNALNNGQSSGQVLNSKVNANTSNISTNTSNISANTSNISTNTSNISTNTSKVNANTSNISTNTSDININTSDIADLTTRTGIVQVDYFVAGTYGDDVEARLLQVDMKTYSRWSGLDVKLQSVSVTHNIVDSGSEAFININMNGVDGLNGNGVQLGAAGTWVTSTDASTATLSDGDYIDIKCSVAGSSGDASDLTVICVFEYILYLHG